MTKKELANSAKTCKDEQELTEVEKVVHEIMEYELEAPFPKERSIKYARMIMKAARKQITSEIDKIFRRRMQCIWATSRVLSCLVWIMY